MFRTRSFPLFALLHLVFLLGASGALAAQGDELPLVAVIVDAQGAPVADARLRVLGREHVAAALGRQKLDLRFDADARGRVRTKLPARFGFAIWAERRLESGALQLSELVTEQHGRGALRLHMKDPARSPQSVRIQGRAAWQERGPFSLHARLQGAYDFEFELPRSATGDFSLHPLPGNQLMLELRDRNGSALHRFDYVHRWNSGPLLEFPLPAPLLVEVRTLDKETGKALPNCKVDFGAGIAPNGRSRMLAAPFRPVALLPGGRTGADGQLRLALPWTEKTAQFGILTAEHSGYRRAGFRMSKLGKSDYEVSKDKETGRKVVEVRMSKSVAIRGRLVDAKGNALAGVPLLHRSSATYYAGPKFGTSTHEIEPRIVHSDEQGRFEITGWAPGRSRGLFAVFDQESLTRLRDGLPEEKRERLGEYPLARLLPVWSGRIPDEPKRIDVGDWSPAQLDWLPVRIQRRDGRGAGKGRVLYATARGSAVLAHADGRGRSISWLGTWAMAIAISSSCAATRSSKPERSSSRPSPASAVASSIKEARRPRTRSSTRAAR
jgi:hypothetical protein